MVGPNHCSGLVKVFYNDTRGIVFTDGWDLKEAQVVYRQLGCWKAISALHKTHFGQGSDPIWLNDVDCEGSEASLFECKVKSCQKNTCNHGEDTSVVGSGNPHSSPCSGICKELGWGS